MLLGWTLIFYLSWCKWDAVDTGQTWDSRWNTGHWTVGNNDPLIEKRKILFISHWSFLRLKHFISSLRCSWENCCNKDCWCLTWITIKVQIISLLSVWMWCVPEISLCWSQTWFINKTVARVSWPVVTRRPGTTLVTRDQRWQWSNLTSHSWPHPPLITTLTTTLSGAVLTCARSEVTTVDITSHVSWSWLYQVGADLNIVSSLCSPSPDHGHPCPSLTRNPENKKFVSDNISICRLTVIDRCFLPGPLCHRISLQYWQYFIIFIPALILTVGCWSWRYVEKNNQIFQSEIWIL